MESLSIRAEACTKGKSERLLVPPFRDAHIHLLIDGRPADFERLVALSSRYLRRGIFSVYDLGHRSGIGLGVRDFLSQEGAPSFSIRTAGRALFKKGSYGGFLGLPIAGKEEIRPRVDELFRAGVDFIKIIHSGMVSLQDGGQVSGGGFPLEILKELVRAAEARGLKTLCHANSDQAVREAVQAGVSGIEHGFFVSRATLDLMGEKGTSWTPTASALNSLGPSLPPEEKKTLEGVVDRHLEAVAYAASVGLKLRIGTDGGSKGIGHGESFFQELALFQRAGLSLEQILSAACLDQGRIAGGDYLLIRRDFIRRKRIESVFSGGRLISSEETSPTADPY